MHACGCPRTATSGRSFTLSSKRAPNSDCPRSAGDRTDRTPGLPEEPAFTLDLLKDMPRRRSDGWNGPDEEAVKARIAAGNLAAARRLVPSIDHARHRHVLLCRGCGAVSVAIRGIEPRRDRGDPRRCSTALQRHRLISRNVCHLPTPDRDTFATEFRPRCMACPHRRDSHRSRLARSGHG